MSWYAAHLVMSFRLKDRPQHRFTVWENIVLIQADTIDEAYAKAERRGHEDASDDESLTMDGQPARLFFAGVRQLIECQEPEERPGDGSEVSYMEMEFDSAEALDRYVNAQTTTAQLWGRCSDEGELPAEEGSQPCLPPS